MCHENPQVGRSQKMSFEVKSIKKTKTEFHNKYFVKLEISEVLQIESNMSEKSIFLTSLLVKQVRLVTSV